MKRWQMKHCLVAFFAILMSLPTSSYASKFEGLSFTRVYEPNEAAFSILVPKGWQAEGGIFRINPLAVGGPLNSMEAKCDLLFKSDSRGSVVFRILPDVVYGHRGIGGGFFSHYQGAEVRPIETAGKHLNTIFFANHPNANSVKQLKKARMDGEIRSMNQGMAFTNQLLDGIGLPHATFQNDAAAAVFSYTEDGVRYREAILTGITDMRAALTWKNTRSLSFRAPDDEFDRWRPVMDIMRMSVRFNRQWILKETEGQKQRAELVNKVLAEVRRIDQEIALKTSVNREEIMNDNFLVLTEQEEFVNPHNGEVEVDTDAFMYRWSTPGGDRYYTDREDENPNTFMQRTDYKKTPVRKRRNE